MKILIPVNGFSRSGGSRVLSKLASAFVEAGDTVDFLCPEHRATPYYPTLGNIVTYRHLSTSSRVLNNLSRTVQLVRALKEMANQYDVVLANQHMTALPVWACTRQKHNGYYYIQAYEPELYDAGLRSVLPRLLARLTYKLDLTRIVNADTYRNYKDLSARFVVEPGLDTSLFNPVNRKRWSPPEIQVGCIGRHEKWKGTAEIINGVRDAASRLGPSVHIHLNIAFQLPKEFQDNLPPNTSLVQPHGDANLANFYKSNDIFIATGLIQDGAFHYPCAESLACGCTVISNYAPGRPDNCYFLENVTSEKISSALYRAVTDLQSPAGAAREKTTAYETQDYAWARISDKMRAIFKGAACS